MGKDNSIKGRTAFGAENRIYFLGEIFWTERAPWKTTPFGKNPDKPFRAGMVFVKSTDIGPVLMIPGSSRNMVGKYAFTPERIAHNSSEKDAIGTYHLDWSRSVDRWFIKTNIGTISPQDKLRFAEMAEDYKKNHDDWRK